ncbi:hypothetical protein H2248_006959 [Termitomyces sp. 'cryptogamus']|nr:hypothetical protein H2248_006959 [Termitomyces sp. 'cryptogamus']
MSWILDNPTYQSPIEDQTPWFQQLHSMPYYPNPQAKSKQGTGSRPRALNHATLDGQGRNPCYVRTEADIGIQLRHGILVLPFSEGMIRYSILFAGTQIECKPGRTLHSHEDA